MTTAQEAHISHLNTTVLQCLVVNWRFYTSFLIGAQSVLMGRAIRVAMIRVTLCRGGPMCPPVLVRALYAIWADTQVRPYTNHINTKSSAIRSCNTRYRWCKGVRPPLAGGRTGVVDSSSPTHKGSINQVASSFRGSFGTLPLRPTAMIRRTSARSFCMRLMGGVVVLM